MTNIATFVLIRNGPCGGSAATFKCNLFIPVLPLSVFSSRVAIGRATQWLGLFQIPEESRSPQVVASLQTFLSESQRRPRFFSRLKSDWASLQ